MWLTQQLTLFGPSLSFFFRGPWSCIFFLFVVGILRTVEEAPFLCGSSLSLLSHHQENEKEKESAVVAEYVHDSLEALSQSVGGKKRQAIVVASVLLFILSFPLSKYDQAVKEKQSSLLRAKGELCSCCWTSLNYLRQDQFGAGEERG